MARDYTAYDGYPDNQWWAAAASSEVGDKPLGRVLLEQPVVIFRPAPGEVAILEDRCSHRQVPLSFGSVVEGAVQCNYHGLRFGADGRCVFAPGMASPPRAADIRGFPVAERHGYIWVWFGSMAPDPALIPDYSWQTSAEYRGKITHTAIGCSYLLGLENVLDLSHFSYLHPTSVGSAGYADIEPETWLEDGEVRCVRVVEKLTPSALFRPLTKAPTVTLTDALRWKGPSYMFLTTTVAAYDGVFNMRGLAPYTPEHRGSHHHWFSHFVDFPIDEAAAEMIAKVAWQAIGEDRVVLEANQQRIDNGMARNPVMLPGDKAPNLMRQLHRDLITRSGLYAPDKAWRAELDRTSRLATVAPA